LLVVAATFEAAFFELALVPLVDFFGFKAGLADEDDEEDDDIAI